MKQWKLLIFVTSLSFVLTPVPSLHAQAKARFQQRKDLLLAQSAHILLKQLAEDYKNGAISQVEYQKGKNLLCPKVDPDDPFCGVTVVGTAVQKDDDDAN